MKVFCNLLIIGLWLSPCGIAKQDHQEGAGTTNPKTIGLQKNWKTVNVAIANLSFSLPPDFTQKSATDESQRNGDVTWTEYYYAWEKPRENPDSPLFEVNVFITNWDKGFPPEASSSSPEAILEAMYSADERNKNSGKAPIEELNYLEIDGVKGEFFRAANPVRKDGVWLNWLTFRYQNNKAQKLDIRVAGARSHLEELTAILRSAKLARK